MQSIVTNATTERDFVDEFMTIVDRLKSLLLIRNNKIISAQKYTNACDSWPREKDERKSRHKMCTIQRWMYLNSISIEVLSHNFGCFKSRTNSNITKYKLSEATAHLLYIYIFMLTYRTITFGQTPGVNYFDGKLRLVCRFVRLLCTNLNELSSFERFIHGNILCEIAIACRIEIQLWRCRMYNDKISVFYKHVRRPKKKSIIFLVEWLRMLLGTNNNSNDWAWALL